MSNLLTPEIAMAIQKGERDYADLLYSLEFVRDEETSVVDVDNLNENQALGYRDLERRLRDAA